MKARNRIKEERWQQLLAWAHAQVCNDHARKGPEPYGLNDFAGGNESWSSDSEFREPACADDWLKTMPRLEEFKPHTDAEKREAEFLKRIIASDRAETIESALAGMELKEALHMTDEQVVEANEYNAFEALPLEGKAAMAEVPSLRVCLYARTWTILQGDKEEDAHAAQGRTVSAGSRKGGESTAKESKRKRDAFLVAFQQAKEANPRHTTQGWLDTAIGSLMANGITIGRSTAWSYLTPPKRVTPKATPL